MTLSCIAAPRARLALALPAVLVPAVLVLALLAPAFPAHAQSDPPAAAPTPAPELTQTIFLNNATSQTELNDMQTALRNMLPGVRVYAVQSQSAITLRGSADEQAVAQHLVSQLDRPHHAYRLTYTITESDAGKPAGAQHVALIVLPGAKTVLKQGTRVPLLTAGADNDAKSQVQYIDIGLSIEASIDDSPGALHFSTLVEQSSLADDKSATAPQDPIIHQTKLEGAAELTPNKPLLLSALDLPGSAHHLQVEVVAEPVR